MAVKGIAQIASFEEFDGTDIQFRVNIADAGPHTDQGLFGPYSVSLGSAGINAAMDADIKSYMNSEWSTDIGILDSILYVPGLL